MTHLTFTGYYAGRPLCNVNKPDALQRGDKFVHAIYCHDLNDPDLCPDCKKLWESVDDDEEEV